MNYSIDMANTQFSTVMSQLKKKEGDAQPTKNAAVPKKLNKTIGGYVAPPKAQGEPDVLLALESVKELVETYGAEKVRRIVDLLS